MAMLRGIEPRSPERQSGIIAFIPWHHILAFLTRVGKHSARFFFPSSPVSNSGVIGGSGILLAAICLLFPLNRGFHLNLFGVVTLVPLTQVYIWQLSISNLVGVILSFDTEDIHDYLFNDSVYNRSVPKALLNSLPPN